MQLRAPQVALFSLVLSGSIAGCSGGGGPPACVPQVEVCNGRDDDCDGLVDEDLGTITCGVGICARSVPACTGGVTGTCVPGLPQAEVCNNGLDDNCDGVVDEGCVCAAGDTQPCYTGPPGTANVGICSPGVQTCDAGHWGACVGAVVPVAETCNGRDDDCDGVTDNGLSAPLNPVQLGACAGTLQRCSGTGGWMDDYAAAPGYGLPETPDGSFADENCDGIDGDV